MPPLAAVESTFDRETGSGRKGCWQCRRHRQDEAIARAAVVFRHEAQINELSIALSGFIGSGVYQCPYSKGRKEDETESPEQTQTK